MSFIDEHRDRFALEPICTVLEVSDKTYSARKRRPRSRREVGDERLLAAIRRAHNASGGTYGSRRCWKQLAREGICVGRCRVERLMRADGICGAQHGRKPFLTHADEHPERPADVVNRRFVACRPNQLLVCDLTYVNTYQGFLYLAFVLAGTPSGYCQRSQSLLSARVPWRVRKAFAVLRDPRNHCQ
jgi:hypothetical protein